MVYKVILTRRAERDFQEIIDYLDRRWTDKEITAFRQRLSRVLDILEQVPYAFPKSQYGTDLRKAVHSKQTSIYYQIRGDEVYIVHIFHTRKDPERIN